MAYEAYNYQLADVVQPWIAKFCEMAEEAEYGVQETVQESVQETLDVQVVNQSESGGHIHAGSNIQNMGPDIDDYLEELYAKFWLGMLSVKDECLLTVGTSDSY